MPAQSFQVRFTATSFGLKTAAGAVHVVTLRHGGPITFHAHTKAEVRAWRIMGRGTCVCFEFWASKFWLADHIMEACPREHRERIARRDTGRRNAPESVPGVLRLGADMPGNLYGRYRASYVAFARDGSIATPQVATVPDPTTGYAMHRALVLPKSAARLWLRGLGLLWDRGEMRAVVSRVEPTGKSWRGFPEVNVWPVISTGWERVAVAPKPVRARVLVRDGRPYLTVVRRRTAGVADDA